MPSKRRWSWIALFILAVLLLGTLATGWNWVYIKTAELKHQAENPWLPIILGSLGFFSLLIGLILFFARLLREMHLNQFQSEFLAAVSHELKTPISTLELTSSLLQQPQVSEQEKKQLWLSHQLELKRLRQDVEAVLETLRWEAGPVPLDFRNLHLETWLTQEWGRWKQILGPNGKLERIGSPLPSLFLRCDTRQFELIFVNLIENSKKFAKETPLVHISTAQETPGRWSISLRDYGWGVEEKNLKKIFKRFYRAKTNAPHPVAGTGLGLHLVASACQAMNIHIRAEIPTDSLGGIRFVLEGEVCPNV